jgi:hypothetical protein
MVVATHYLKVSLPGHFLAAYAVIFEVVYVCLLWRVATPENRAKFTAILSVLLPRAWHQGKSIHLIYLDTTHLPVCLYSSDNLVGKSHLPCKSYVHQWFSYRSNKSLRLRCLRIRSPGTEGSKPEAQWQS